MILSVDVCGGIEGGYFAHGPIANPIGIDEGFAIECEKTRQCP